MDFLNVIICNGNIHPSDAPTLFPKNEPIEAFLPEEVDIFDLLVKLGAFPSKSQARKSWKGLDKIPDGWSMFWVGKFRRILCIWNPSEPLTQEENENVSDP